MPHLDRLGVVVHTNGYGVFTRIEHAIKIEDMGDGERLLHAVNLLAIDPHLSGDMGSLKIEVIHRQVSLVG